MTQACGYEKFPLKEGSAEGAGVVLPGRKASEEAGDP
jgi:hypothetical protein